MPDSLFVKTILDQIYPQLQPQQGLDDFIKDQIAALSENYAQAATSASINFSDPRTRAAYIYQYVTAHARYLARILQEGENALGKRLLGMPDPKIACLGGGPGTDALGVVKYLQALNPPAMLNTLECCILDKEPAWEENWNLIANQAGIVPHFCQLDVTQPLGQRAKSFLEEADLITMSYLISEVEKLNANGVVVQFLQECFHAAKRGSLFVYVDNSGGHTGFFDSASSSLGWNLVTSWDFGPGATQWGSFREDLTPLDSYQAKFVRHYKIAGRLSYRIFQKP